VLVLVVSANDLCFRDIRIRHIVMDFNMATKDNSCPVLSPPSGIWSHYNIAQGCHYNGQQMNVQFEIATKFINIM